MNKSLILIFFLFSGFSYGETEQQILGKVKYYLTNGETRLARAYLTKLSFSDKKQKNIIDFYQAIFDFNEGKVKESYSKLNQKKFNEEKFFKNICLFKTLVQIKLKEKNFYEDWERCKILNKTNLGEKDLKWIETLVTMVNQKELKPSKILNKNLISLSQAELKSVLKLALFLNIESELLSQIPDLSVEQISDPEIRDIIGQIYFRQKKIKLAYKYISDLAEPNAENMKGNLYLLQGNYDLAYLQFKSALEKKKNSKNSIERLLPLSMILKDYAYGEKMINQLQTEEKWHDHKKVIQALFQFKNKNYQKSIEKINEIQSVTRVRNELDINQILSLNYLFLKNISQVQLPAARACEAGDYIFCFIKTQLNKWDRFDYLVLREDKIHPENNWRELTKKYDSNGIDEKVYINQIDIEELDEKELSLFKSP